VRSVVPLPGNERLAGEVARALGVEVLLLQTRSFPDGETYVRIDDVRPGEEVVVVATLARPDEKLLPLAFVADAVRDLGAARVGLVAPYLAYLRQDARFLPGEAVTSRTFARLLSSSFDWLVTVDPHLHRYASLDEIYAIPSRVVAAAPHLAAWIGAHVRDPLVVGPDAESEQWAAEIARRAGAPHVVLVKRRRGDRDVEVDVPDLSRFRGRTPVLVDDIVSTAHTMIEAVRGLRAAGFASPACAAVHAIFAAGALEELRAAGAGLVVTCDTIVHPTNAIGLAEDLAAAVAAM
jgi:ribose-phosphate pyrophosphokinase